MAEPSADASLFQWIVGGIVAALGAAFGHLLHRIMRVEDRVDAGAATARREGETKNKELWDALDEDRRDAQQFRERISRDMVTKEDLRDMERRLTGQLNGNRLGHA